MEDISSILIEYLSVANSDSHELVTMSSAWVTIDWILKIFSGSLPFWWLLDSTFCWVVVDSIGILMLFNLSELIEFVKCWLSNWNNFFDHVPKDSLWAWNRSQRSLVGPSSVEVKERNELVHVDRSCLGFQSEKWFLICYLIINHLRQSFVMEINSEDFFSWNFFGQLFEEWFWDTFKNEA